MGFGDRAEVVKNAVASQDQGSEDDGSGLETTPCPVRASRKQQLPEPSQIQKPASNERYQNGRSRQYIKKKITGFDNKTVSKDSSSIYYFVVFYQDMRLKAMVKKYGENSWNRISKLLGKSEIKCHKRYLELTGRS